MNKPKVRREPARLVRRDNGTRLVVPPKPGWRTNRVEKFHPQNTLRAKCEVCGRTVPRGRKATCSLKCKRIRDGQLREATRVRALKVQNDELAEKGLSRFDRGMRFILGLVE